ncbi:MAG TPA: hypothetical protein VLK65_14350 [Vicinamibacteria bacterium]|nr:hypothetical protein [Vicinamibacteria bacterium]
MANPIGSSLQLLTGRLRHSGVELHIILHWSLRIGCAMCWIGHGVWGVITKAGWLPFFAVFGIPEETAYKLMPLVGTVDITLGMLMLFHPTRANLTWMVVWTTFTALLRPIVGMGWWEFLERGGNYGPPLAFLFLAFATGQKAWFQRLAPRAIDPRDLAPALWTLRIAIALLLIGHGGFGAFQVKQTLVGHWSALGIPADEDLIRLIGWAEIIAGFAVMLRQSIPLLMVLFYWKVATELLHPIAGRFVDIWEWVERGGDFGAPIALATIYLMVRSLERTEGALSKQEHAVV